MIEPLGHERPPQTYDLCGPHAARTRPPHGWTLRDLVPGATPSEEAPAISAARPGGRDAGGHDAGARLAALLDTAADARVRDAGDHRETTARR